MFLPYISGIRKNHMRKPKSTIATRRRVKAEVPEIFIRVREGSRSNYARASIRIKAGRYLYLVWRDGGRIRNFYLGKKRIS